MAAVDLWSLSLGTVAPPARRRVAALQPHQSVIFDSGNTVLEASRAAVQRSIRFTAVTNDLAIAQLLGGSRHVQVQVSGGQLRSCTARR